MPNIFWGRQGTAYNVIEPPIGKGGEGSVYRISGMPDYVLKVFIDSKRTETRHRKLLAMVTTPLSPSAMQQITWPADVVYLNGSFAGYIMPAIKNNEDLNVMYSDKYNCTLSEKITIAKNLCAAINAIHEAGQVCGDLNPKNIGVDPRSARITLLDTDSYHITEANGSRVYRCEVGLPEYLPREIQEKMKNGFNLATAPLPTFTKYTDRFALAVHIFALLMNGCHPFACAINNQMNIGSLAVSQPSVAVPQPIDNICNGFFPFYTKRAGYTIPKYAPSFDMLPTYIQDMFIKAFVNGHNNPAERPDTVAWYNALSTMQKDLKVCSINKVHMYPKHLRKCPWCEIEARMATALPHNSYTASQINTLPTNTQNYPLYTNKTSQPVNSGPTAPTEGIQSASAFWPITLIVPLLVQAVVQGIWGQQIVAECFGTEYGEGMYAVGENLGIFLGPWGFVICGVIGSIVYNKFLCKNGQMYGYQPYHYALSMISSFVCSAAWLVVVGLITIVVVLVVSIFVGAVVCSILSGS